MFVQSFSCVQLFVVPRTIAHQAPLSMESSQQEYWSRWPFPNPGDLPNSRNKPTSLGSPALACGFFTTSATKFKPKCLSLAFKVQSMHPTLRASQIATVSTLKMTVANGFMHKEAAKIQGRPSPSARTALLCPLVNHLHQLITASAHQFPGYIYKIVSRLSSPYSQEGTVLITLLLLNTKRLNQYSGALLYGFSGFHFIFPICTYF